MSTCEQVNTVECYSIALCEVISSGDVAESFVSGWAVKALIFCLDASFETPISTASWESI